MSAPEMYTLTDYPDFRERFNSLEDLIGAVESQSEGLNQIVSWFIFDEGHEDWMGGDGAEVHVLIFMPRLSKTTEFGYVGAFDRSSVQAWLDGYVKERTMRWFGWAE